MDILMLQVRGPRPHLFGVESHKRVCEAGIVYWSHSMCKENKEAVYLEQPKAEIHT